MKRVLTHAVLVAGVLWAIGSAPVSAYTFPTDDYEYAICGWGGSCQGWFYPSQYYLNFEPNPQQYEFVDDVYPMEHAYGSEWYNQAMQWYDYSRVNPAPMWGDGGYYGM
jgi:hypothetical protein